MTWLMTQATIFLSGQEKAISGSNTTRAFALSMNSSLVISEAAPPITLDGNHLVCGV